MKHEKRKRLFKVLSTKGLSGEEERHTLILAFTDGRTHSTSKLSDYEAEQLIRLLEDPQYEASNKMRRKVISRAYEMRWGNPNNRDGRAETMRCIDQWCLNKSYLKKPLNQYEYDELPKLLSQFEEVYKWFLNNI